MLGIKLLWRLGRLLVGLQAQGMRFGFRVRLGLEMVVN